MGEIRTIAIDGMGGDHAPTAVVDGLSLFARDNADSRFVIFGDGASLKVLLDQYPAVRDRTEIRHCERAVAMDEKPAQAVRQGRGTSMWGAIEAVKSGEAVGAVSAGNTGALMAMSKLILRMVEGAHRPALVGTWPTRTGVSAVLDLGADIAADPEQLIEFAIMGVAFAHAVHHKPDPVVGLLNIGSEDLKGHESIREAARLMRTTNLGFRFHGFVEGDDISAGTVDVVVSDGFTGNIALKTAEGAARMISDLLREELNSSVRSRMGALMALPALNRLRERLDPRRVNGAVFLGLNGVVVKSHGGADAFGISKAISVAADMGDSRYKSEIASNLSRLAAVMQTAGGERTSEEAAK